MHRADLPKTKTFEVLAGAYHQSNLFSFLTHACEVDADGFAVSVVCNRVRLDSICNDAGWATDDAPTCKTCALRLAKRK